MKANESRGPYAKHVFVHWREEGATEGDGKEGENARSGILRLTVRGRAEPLLTVHPGTTVALGQVRVQQSVRRELDIEVGAGGAVLGQPQPVTGLSVEMKGGKLAAGERMPLVLVFQAEKAGRFRCVLSVPVLSPKGHPPVELLVHGTAVEAE